MACLRLLGPIALLLPFALAHCTADTSGEDVSEGSDNALSTEIHSEYGITMFGGSGDFQPMSCGLSSRTAQSSHPYYVASSQRYGCKVHLKITAPSGKCVVASTEDAGPATAVERHAGMAVLDSSPAVVHYLFPGAGEIGWVDIKKSPAKYTVKAEVTDLPLGPCDDS